MRRAEVAVAGKGRDGAALGMRVGVLFILFKSGAGGAATAEGARVGS